MDVRRKMPSRHDRDPRSRPHDPVRSRARVSKKARAQAPEHVLSRTADLSVGRSGEVPINEHLLCYRRSPNKQCRPRRGSKRPERQAIPKRPGVHLLVNAMCGGDGVAFFGARRPLLKRLLWATASKSPSGPILNCLQSANRRRCARAGTQRSPGRP